MLPVLQKTLLRPNPAYFIVIWIRVIRDILIQDKHYFELNCYINPFGTTLRCKRRALIARTDV